MAKIVLNESEEAKLQEILGRYDPARVEPVAQFLATMGGVENELCTIWRRQVEIATRAAFVLRGLVAHLGELGLVYDAGAGSEFCDHAWDLIVTSRYGIDKPGDRREQQTLEAIFGMEDSAVRDAADDLCVRAAAEAFIYLGWGKHVPEHVRLAVTA